MKRVILRKRIYWWRFFFDTIQSGYRIGNTRVFTDMIDYHKAWVCRLMLPCADNYRPGRARNDNVKPL
jgi:hypothetical protein